MLIKILKLKGRRLAWILPLTLSRYVVARVLYQLRLPNLAWSFAHRLNYHLTVAISIFSRLASWSGFASCYPRTSSAPSCWSRRVLPLALRRIHASGVTVSHLASVEKTQRSTWEICLPSVALLSCSVPTIIEGRTCWKQPFPLKNGMAFHLVFLDEVGV